MYRRVLVPLDGSALAKGILPFVLQIAGPLDLEVILARVMPPIMPHAIEGTCHFMADDVAARLKEGREYLNAVATDLRGRGVRVTTDARHGDPVVELVGAARDAGADLIAMTTHGRSGIGRLLFGSVAEAVLRQSEVPVLMMRLTEGKVSAAEDANHDDADRPSPGKRAAGLSSVP